MMQLLKHGFNDAAAKAWFQQQQVTFMKENDNWLIDENYQRTMEMRVKEADLVLWLQTSRVQGVYRAIKRSIKRRFFHEERLDMAEEFEEKWDKEFLDFLIFIWQFKDHGEKKIAELLTRYPEKKVVILKNAKEKEAFLESL